MADIAAQLIRSDNVRKRWAEPSALEGYSVSGLAGHLARAVFTVETYLDSSGTTEPVSPAEYFVSALADLDPVTSVEHRAVRERATTDAGASSSELADRMSDTLASLRLRLRSVAQGATVAVFGAKTMTVDDYLATRVVELVVHMDDLAASVGVAATALPDHVMPQVIDVLSRIAAGRHGDREVMRAFARRERVGEWPHAF